MTPSEIIHKDLEADILDAARDLIAEGGLDRLSMRAVAEKVGVSATAIYHYFQGKQDLVERVVKRAFERFGGYLERAMREHPRGSVERIRALGEAYIRFALENQAYFRVIFSLEAPDPRALEDLPGGGGYELLRQSVEDAIEAGNYRKADPDLMSLYLWSVCHGLITLALACRFEECSERGNVPTSPLELFHALGPFVQAGVLSDEARVAAVALPGAGEAE